MRKSAYTFVKNKSGDQLLRLISVFVFPCLDRTISISIISLTYILILLLAYINSQAGLCLTLSKAQKTAFHNEAHILSVNEKLPVNSVNSPNQSVLLTKNKNAIVAVQLYLIYSSISKFEYW